MGKKIKSKARLDKYYYLAKEHGFRSRAAFKLIQLNKKFQFLEKSSCLIDLCAAPGGWLQVAAKYMPVSSIKIGVDLDPIKSVHGCTTFQADITSEKCRFLIKKEIKHFKADIVLNDGAPNVGGNWTKDAYNQSELVLFALKLATEFLKEGGWFITKIFRSSDYNSLIYVLKQLFGKVEATKPQASRSESAEIFVVCQNYKAPNFIDKKLLDPKHALKQLEDEDEMKMNSIKSIKAMFDKKVNRGGYSGKLYNEKTFADFVESANPYQFLTEVNKIKINEDSQKYIKTMRVPLDYELYFDDIQILGKKEIQQLIIWRNKIRSKMQKKEPKAGKEDEAEEPEDYEEKKIEELDEEMHAIEVGKKRKLQKEQKKREKQDLRMKMSFNDRQASGYEDNTVDFDQNTFNFLKNNNIDIESIPYTEIDDNIQIPQQEVEEIDLSDLSEDDYVEMMNEDIEENMRLHDEERKLKKPRERIGKRKKYIEGEDGEEAGEEEEDERNKYNDDGIVYQPAEQEEELQLESEQDGSNTKGSSKVGHENHGDDDDSFLMDDYLNDNEFENPLRKKKNKNKKGETATDDKAKSNDPEGDEENNLSSDTDEEDEQMLGKKKKRNGKHEEIEEVPRGGDTDEDYDTDEQAEIRAIAKKMLRKKDRLNILYKSYNRFAFSDLHNAPDWFVEDERQHNQPSKPVTKEEIMREKEVLKKFNDRMPKKVLEAKARKKNKLARKMDKVKKKAQVISNQEEINEISKVKQIEKLYKKELSKSKEKKKYVVNRSSRIKTGKNSRNIRFVDNRLKKDKRAKKASEKRKRR